MHTLIRIPFAGQAYIEWRGVCRPPAGPVDLWRDGGEFFAALGPLYVIWTPARVLKALEFETA